MQEALHDHMARAVSAHAKDPRYFSAGVRQSRLDLALDHAAEQSCLLNFMAWL